MREFSEDFQRKSHNYANRVGDILKSLLNGSEYVVKKIAKEKASGGDLIIEFLSIPE